MGTIRQFSVTLTQDLAELVQSKVASGEYASESEVIGEGLRALRTQDQALEHWLRTEVVDAYDRVEDGTEKGYSSEEVRSHLAEWVRSAKPTT